MSSKAAFDGRSQILSAEKENPFLTPYFRPSSRRSASLSSPSSSFSSYSSTGSMSFPGHSQFRPKTPLRFSGIPFSWEKLPGIPKQQTPKKTETPLVLDLLPLPPATNPISISSKKFSALGSCRRDPFYAALVKCSKDDDDQHGGNNNNNIFKEVGTRPKVTTRNSSSLSDRLSFVATYTSCKSPCAIAESIIYIPRSRNHAVYHRVSH